MEKKILKKFANWKKVFTQGYEGLNEDSSWREILLSREYNSKELNNLCNEAEKAEGLLLTSEDNHYLFTLPYYEELTDFLENMPRDGWGDWTEKPLSDGNRICFVRDVVGNIEFTEATIVTKQKIEGTLDLCRFVRYEGHVWFIENVTIRYAKEPPKEWLRRVQIWFMSLGFNSEKNENGYGH